MLPSSVAVQKNKNTAYHAGPVTLIIPVPVGKEKYYKIEKLIIIEKRIRWKLLTLFSDFRSISNLFVHLTQLPAIHHS
jgi:hypothetical protein